MGYTGAYSMAELAGLDAALHWHLRHNHYPPVPEVMLPLAKDAIAAALADDWDALLPLPEGVSHKRYGIEAPVHAIVEHLHLQGFIDQANDEGDGE